MLKKVPLTFHASTAHFDGPYRYSLSREWGFPTGPMLVVIGLNPSTADAIEPDPTVTRCCERARRSGYGGLWMMNLFALKSTDPTVMLRHPDPVGPDNDDFLRTVCSGRDVLCAWGNDGRHLGRGQQAIEMLGRDSKLLQLGDLTGAGQPRHPLYVGYDVPMVPLARKSR